MTGLRKNRNLDEYRTILPYSSELFGIYQPLLGWKSRRAKKWLDRLNRNAGHGVLDRLTPYFRSTADIEINADCVVSSHDYRPADFARRRQLDQQSVLLEAVRQGLPGDGSEPDEAAWQHALRGDILHRILEGTVLPHYSKLSVEYCQRLASQDRDHVAVQRERELAHLSIEKALAHESEIAGALIRLLDAGRFDLLDRIFFADAGDSKAGFMNALNGLAEEFKDPLESFDPKTDAGLVTVSPLGITHIFRQYFFELDSFLGTPVSHVWLSPGSTVELVEVSTRRTLTEKIVEQSLETIHKRESSTTDSDEISEAIKQENKNDLKMGVSTTVNQSWGTGNITATGSLNMDTSQTQARETTHKRMRQQSDKVSSEIRQNYKTTFRTVTETTDTVSKRYVLANTTPGLINYELRRKMRQVAVQVQDIGTYLCWDTFIDEPGADLGLANLIHVAQPADLLPVPDQTEIAVPGDRTVTFRTNATWNWGEQRKHGFVPLTVIDLPPAPDGFEPIIDGSPVPVAQISAHGEDFSGAWAFEGRFTPAGQIEVGVVTGPRGLEWDERVEFVVGGAVAFRANAAKRAEIAAANDAKRTTAAAASAENDRKQREAFMKAARERIDQARSITTRKYEDLREEERIIVYRRLIRSLMTDSQYRTAGDRDRHVLAQLINTIFDVDKMLYFVAPEWWKPREHSKLALSINDLNAMLGASIVSWSDSRSRPDNYLITDKSLPAAMGSSLGWLLQLDGDDMRNAFLNAPWVKAVMPVRPGREQAAINWLSEAGVEGADGLGDGYEAPDDELDEIRASLGIPGTQKVTLRNAIDFLCKRVAQKHADSNRVKSVPEGEINDDNKVLATPVEKVYEHGFYPLQGGFRVSPTDPGGDPNNQDRDFQVFDEWIEILPTDQVVPVEVSYDPTTGRQV